MAAFIGGNVSPAELQRRIEDGYQAVFSSPPETLSALQSMYGVDAAHMAAFFLDPTKGEKIITQKWTAAQIGGQASKSGFGDISAAEGEKLAGSGLGAKDAGGAFGALVQGAQLTEGMTREEQLAAAGGDATEQQKIQAAGAKKKAAFGDGGTFASGQGGVSGLGTSNS